MGSTGWDRDTPWRQGKALSQSTSLSLAVLDPERADSHIAVVISHDCDLVEDVQREPDVEVIVGKFIDAASPNHTHAKSPNTLHLELAFDGQPRTVEFAATAKCRKSKASIAKERPDDRFILDPKGLDILQTWLALRYRRAAFPDSLNKHLSELRETLQRIGKRNPHSIVGFYVYFEPEGEISDPNEPYEVWIVVVYDHTRAEAEGIAEEAAKKISEKLEAKFKTAMGWRGIDLRRCDYSSDEEFSLYHARTFKNYPLDYISLRS
jgi:hypothetical protein